MFRHGVESNTKQSWSNTVCVKFQVSLCFYISEGPPSDAFSSVSTVHQMNAQTEAKDIFKHTVGVWGNIENTERRTILCFILSLHSLSLLCLFWWIAGQRVQTFILHQYTTLCLYLQKQSTDSKAVVCLRSKLLPCFCPGFSAICTSTFSEPCTRL